MQPDFETIPAGNSLLLLNQAPGAFAITIKVSFGSAYEKKKNAGTAHFIEHMFFSGTKKTNRFEISKKIDSIGGVMNAFTSRENIYYYIKTSKENKNTAIETLFECFNNCAFFEKELELERNIILNEIRELYDNPVKKVIVNFSKECLPNNFGRPIIGSMETVSGIKKEEIFKEFKKSHSPKNSIVSISIPPTAKAKEKLVEKIAPFMESKKRQLKLKPMKAKQKEKEVWIEKETEQSHICIGFPAPATTSKDYAAFTALEAILGGGLSSRIVHEIREKRGLSYAVHAFHEAEPKHGYYCVYLATNPKNTEKAVKVVQKELRKIAENGISKKELEKAKKYISGTNAIEWDDSFERARDAAFAFSSGWSWEEYFKKLNSLTEKEISEIAGKYIDSEKLCKVILTPKTKIRKTH